jgi:hypothetical protein
MKQFSLFVPENLEELKGLLSGSRFKECCLGLEHDLVTYFITTDTDIIQLRKVPSPSPRTPLSENEKAILELLDAFGIRLHRS